MKNRTIYILIALAAAYFLFVRKRNGNGQSTSAAPAADGRPDIPANPDVVSTTSGSADVNMNIDFTDNPLSPVTPSNVVAIQPPGLPNLTPAFTAYQVTVNPIKNNVFNGQPTFQTTTTALGGKVNYSPL